MKFSCIENLNNIEFINTSKKMWLTYLFKSLSVV